MSYNIVIHRTKIMRKFLIALSLLVLTSSVALAATKVAIVSTGLEAAKLAQVIMDKNHWQESSVGDATYFLVIVHSTEAWPLENSYPTYSQLSEAATALGGPSDKNTHIYIYNKSLDGTLTVRKHTRLKPSEIPTK